MKSTLATLLVAPLAILTLGAGGARGKSPGGFRGLWEGVDVNDGSKRTISITDRDRDGLLEVASRDSYWTLCDGDRGLEYATGRVGRDGVLTTEGEVTCFDDRLPLPIEQTYELSRRDDTLFATPVGTGLVPITLHRVSH